MRKKYSEKMLQYTKVKEEISEGLKSFEAKRIAILTKIYLYCFGSLGIFILFILYIINAPSFFSHDSFMLSPVVSVILVLLFVISVYYLANYVSKAPREFLKDLKRPFLPRLLPLFGDITWYERENNHEYVLNEQCDSILTNSTLKKSELFAEWNRRKVDDEFGGAFRGVDFKISETSMLYESGSGKNRTCTCVFNGIVISFSTNKKIKAKTMVATKGDLTSKSSWLVSLSCLFFLVEPIAKDVITNGRLSLSMIIICIIFAIAALVFGWISKNVKLGSAAGKVKITKKITLEDPKFNKRFVAYSSDEIEGRYLLTPAFMQRFQGLKTAFGAQKIKCAFFDDQLMVAIQTKKNLFELGALNKSLLKTDFIKDFYLEISSILNMVEHLKLDEKTGL